MEGNTDTTSHDHAARIARTAWLCAFVLPLILTMLLLGVKSAQAAAPAPGFVPLALEEEEFGFEFEGEDELGEEDELEFAEEECEIAQEELEAGEIDKTEADALCAEAKQAIKGQAGPSSAGGECPLRSASAHASTHRDKLKLTIGYTTNSPVAATIQIHKVGTFQRHLGRSGVLRFTKKLGKKHPGKRISVRIRVPSSAGGGRCGLVQVVANKVV